jgi:small subunit ribosomal protein S3
MGQKVHPIALRLGSILKWDNEWYSQSKRVNSKLVYQVYKIRYLLSHCLYKKDLLIHSFSTKYVDDNFYLTIFVVPIYNNSKYFSLHYIKKYFHFFLMKNNFIIKLLNKNKEIKINLRLLKLFLFFEKESFKYVSIPIYNSINYLKKFYNYNNLIKKKILLIKDYLLLSKSLFLFNEFSKINVTVKNLTKLLYFSDEFLKRKVKNQNYNMWFYYFYIMKKTRPSSLLIAYFLKKILETRSLKKKQRFFFNNLRRFLNIFKNNKLFLNIKGIKIHVKGRLNGRNRSSLYKIQIGSIPLSTISQRISYTFIPAFTIYGSFGIKVWIF